MLMLVMDCDPGEATNGGVTRPPLPDGCTAEWWTCRGCYATFAPDEVAAEYYDGAIDGARCACDNGYGDEPGSGILNFSRCRDRVPSSTLDPEEQFPGDVGSWPRQVALWSQGRVWAVARAVVADRSASAGADLHVALERVTPIDPVDVSRPEPLMTCVGCGKGGVTTLVHDRTCETWDDVDIAPDARWWMAEFTYQVAC